MDEGTKEVEPRWVWEAEPTVEVRRHWAIGDNEFSEILGKYHWTKTSQYWEFVPRPGAEFTVPDLLAIIKAEPPFEPNPIKTITVGSAAEESSEKAGSLDPVAAEAMAGLKAHLGRKYPWFEWPSEPFEPTNLGEPYVCRHCGAVWALDKPDQGYLNGLAWHLPSCLYRLVMEAVAMTRADEDASADAQESSEKAGSLDPVGDVWRRPSSWMKYLRFLVTEFVPWEMQGPNNTCRFCGCMRHPDVLLTWKPGVDWEPHGKRCWFALAMEACGLTQADLNASQSQKPVGDRA